MRKYQGKTKLGYTASKENLRTSTKSGFSFKKNKKQHPFTKDLKSFATFESNKIEFASDTSEHNQITNKSKLIKRNDDNFVFRVKLDF